MKRFVVNAGRAAAQLVLILVQTHETLPPGAAVGMERRPGGVACRMRFEVSKRSVRPIHSTFCTLYTLYTLIPSTRGHLIYKIRVNGVSNQYLVKPK
jgi:hypothetical protein